MTQALQVEQLLPWKAEETIAFITDYIEPDARELLADGSVHRVTGISGGGGEWRLRASGPHDCNEERDDTGELIEELQLVYNKARQAAITQELVEQHHDSSNWVMESSARWVPLKASAVKLECREHWCPHFGTGGYGTLAASWMCWATPLRKGPHW